MTRKKTTSEDRTYHLAKKSHRDLVRMVVQLEHDLEEARDSIKTLEDSIDDMEDRLMNYEEEETTRRAKGNEARGDLHDVFTEYIQALQQGEPEYVLGALKTHVERSLEMIRA